MRPSRYAFAGFCAIGSTLFSIGPVAVFTWLAEVFAAVAPPPGPTNWACVLVVPACFLLTGDAALAGEAALAGDVAAAVLALVVGLLGITFGVDGARVVFRVGLVGAATTDFALAVAGSDGLATASSVLAVARLLAKPEAVAVAVLVALGFAGDET
ncbi:hypothetical protein [Phaeobacter sp. C3_T13_0]|uniref:hypothetical protein n=1 Tax=Phaeobacter cretensis TaxID=3342641 RepID=UPI0039BD8734